MKAILIIINPKGLNNHFKKNVYEKDCRQN
jgi:hypothetical protein